MISQEKDDHQVEAARAAVELSALITSFEETRTKDKFSSALQAAIKELSPYVNNFETEAPHIVAKIAKLARLVVSSAESSAKRTPLPENKVALYKAALSAALEPFYKNPRFIQLLSEAIQSGTLTSDEPELIYEMWRDVAKIAHSSAALYRGDEQEDLIKFSGWAWEELLKELPEGHTLRPFMRIEFQVFLADIGLPVKPALLIEDILALKNTDLNKNPHRLGTMALRVEKLGQKIGDKKVSEAGRQVFKELKAERPDVAKLLENPVNSFKALMKKASDSFIAVNAPSPSKTALYSRLISLKAVPFLPETETDVQ